MEAEYTAVLGSGPAGMLVAHAVTQAGRKPVIYTDTQTPSFITGAQYLHKDIPGLTDDVEAVPLRNFYRGSKELYTQKIYGNNPPPEGVSFGTWPAVQWIYPMRDLYMKLWDKFRWHQRLFSVNPENLEDLVQQHGHVFSTVPRMHVTRYADTFQWEAETVGIITVFDVGTQLDIHRDLQLPYPEGNWVVYSGEPQDVWYRVSNLFGTFSMEFPAGVIIRDKFKGVVLNKPLRTNAPAPQDGVHLFGRYGRWEKRQLVTDAYYGAAARLMELYSL